MLTDYLSLSATNLSIESAPRQGLYPVLDGDGQLAGILTGTALADSPAELDQLLITEPVTVHPDDTLRHVANIFAEHAITRAPVTLRGVSDELVGIISLAGLLHARLHDLTEEHHRERHLLAGRPSR